MPLSRASSARSNEGGSPHADGPRDQGFHCELLSIVQHQDLVISLLRPAYDSIVELSS